LWHAALHPRYPSRVAPVRRQTTCRSCLAEPPEIPAPEVFEKVRRGHPLWYRVLSQAYKQFAQSPENRGVYADPEGQGATPEQIWRFFGLFQVEPYCVLARAMPEDQVKGIGRLERRSPEQLVDILRNLQSSSGAVNAATLHYDGATGHCVHITDYDARRERFIYHDPWPADSLLCEKNNMAAVAAQQEDGGRWSVTAQELERVIFASYIFPTAWARLNGVDFDLFYDRWKESDFYQFFHLKLLDEHVENERKRRSFTAGPFKDSVSVVVECQDEKIVSSGLILSQDWAAGNLMLAIDIAKSFVVAFAPSPDQGMFGGISRELQKIRKPDFIRALPRQESDDDAVRCVQAFLGGIEEADVRTDFASLSVKNSKSEAGNRVELAFNLY
jgi:hypothetical protein